MRDHPIIRSEIYIDCVERTAHTARFTKGSTQTCQNTVQRESRPTLFRDGTGCAPGTCTCGCLAVMFTSVLVYHDGSTSATSVRPHAHLSDFKRTLAQQTGRRYLLLRQLRALQNTSSLCLWQACLQRSKYYFVVENSWKQDLYCHKFQLDA